MDLGNKLWDTWQNQLTGSKDSAQKKDENNSNNNKNKNKSNNKNKNNIDINKKSNSNSFFMSHSNSTSVNMDKTNSSNVKMNRSKSAYSTSDPVNDNNNNNNNTYTSTTSNSIGSSYADKFMERIISMAIPTITTSSKRKLDVGLNRIEMQKSRPQLSIQIMSRNSILLLQRLSIPFELIDEIINFINWKNPIVTITIMLFLSLCILKPINLLTLPLFYICFEIIIPAYMIQNPNIDESIDAWEDELPKPVNEFSREFLLNVTDLQNHMLLYVNLWDFINNWCWKLFYFRDEVLTWFIFISLISIGLFLEIFGTSIINFSFPFLKFLTVIFSWLIIIALHPKFRIKILENFYSEELRLKTMSLINYYESKVINDMDLKTDQMEIRQIEIFELQYYNDDLNIWQFACFSKDIYPPNSHIRLNSLPIDGTLTMESIVPPNGWKFINSSDLLHDSFDDLNDFNENSNNNDINNNNNNKKKGNGNINTNDNNNTNDNDKSNDIEEKYKSKTSDNTNNISNSNSNVNLKASIKSNKNKNRNNPNKKLLLFDYEKRRIMKEKRKYQKFLKRQRKKSNGSFNDHTNSNNRPQPHEFLVEDNESSQTNLQRRRASNDFNNILIDPLTLNKTIIEQLKTGVELDGWYLDLNPDNWVVNNYLQSVLDIDEDTKWVYDLVVKGNGIDAYSAGLGVTMGKLKRNRGDVRRRRWVRYAVRDIVQGIHSDAIFSDDDSNEDEEDNDDSDEEYDYDDSINDYISEEDSKSNENKKNTKNDEPSSALDKLEKVATTSIDGVINNNKNNDNDDDDDTKNKHYNDCDIIDILTVV